MEVTTLVVTSWHDLQAMFAASVDLATMAVAAGLATKAQAGALVSDLSAHHADGHFFAVLVAMRCTGVCP